MTFQAGSALLHWNPPQLACWRTKADSTAAVALSRTMSVSRQEDASPANGACATKTGDATGRKLAWPVEQPVDDSTKARSVRH